MSKPKLCLNMIVKNEAHIILETLECASKYIDYYVINDTGSTDNTIEVIKTFFDSKGIKGEIISHEFRTCKCHSGKYKKYSFFHFGWNRTFSMQQCAGKSEYIWIIDADDLVVGDMDFTNLTSDCYMVTIGTGFTYQRGQIFKNDPSYNWRYEGALHEYPTCDKKDHSKSLLPGNYHIDSRRLGDRSKLDDKYSRDAKVFEEVLLEEPENERSMFYCAQSYYDAQDFTNSLKWYKKRIEKGGWFEETFFAYFKVAQCMEEMMKRYSTFTWTEVEKAYLAAYNYCNVRSEPLYYIAKHYREIGDFVNGYKYAKQAARIPYPERAVLFIFKNIYTYKARDELSRCALGLNKYHESYNIAKYILENGSIEHYDFDRIVKHVTDVEQKIINMEKKTCCIYFGNEYVLDKNYEKYIKIIENISKCYTITIVGNNICDNNNSIIIPTTSIGCISKIKFDYLIIWDYVNYFYDNIKINSDITVLLLNDNLIKLRLDNNIYVSIHNNLYLTTITDKINKIICVNQKIKNEFVETYNLIADNVKCLGDDYHELFENVTPKTKYNFKLDIDNETNGLKYYEPNYIKNIDDKYTFGKDMVLNVYENIIKKYPNMLEHHMKVVDILYNFGNYKDALFKIDKVLTLMKNGNKSFKDVIELHKGKMLSKLEKYEESYELINNMLQTNNNIPNKVRDNFEDIRDNNIMYFRDKFLEYPQRKIKSMNNNITNNNVIFTITSCKRFDLFEKTINSFLNCCQDSNLIGQWLCVDDNSSDDDRQKMKKQYPFFKFILKDETQKGHFISMNIIRNYVIENNFTHVLHCEDDFHYFQKRNYITDSVKILTSDDKFGQLLFNKNYAEADFVNRKTKGGILGKLNDGTRYIIHEHYQVGTKEYDNFINKYRGYGTTAYWPGFSFRPSLLKVSMLKEIGPYYNTDHFERAYADEYKSRDFKSVFFDTYCCLHIGKLTWQQSVNSYALNNMGQFSLDKEKLAVNVQSSDVNMFKQFKEHNNNKLSHFVRKDVKQIVGLNDFERKVLVGNEFNYLRPIASSLLFHINMFLECKSNFMLFLKDSVKLCDDFSTKLDEYMKCEFDLIILENTISNTCNDCGLISVDEKINFSIYNGYFISKRGINKVMEYVSRNGIKNINYLDNMINMQVFRTNKICDYENIVNDTTINYETLYKKYDGYKFYCLMDSFGHDINYIGKKSVDEIKLECDKIGGCCFNTLGWIKGNMTKEEQFINLPSTTNICEGLYVKI